VMTWRQPKQAIVPSIVGLVRLDWRQGPLAIEVGIPERQHGNVRLRFAIAVMDASGYSAGLDHREANSLPCLARLNHQRSARSRSAAQVGGVQVSAPRSSKAISSRRDVSKFKLAVGSRRHCERFGEESSS